MAVGGGRGAVTVGVTGGGGGGTEISDIGATPKLCCGRPRPEGSALGRKGDVDHPFVAVDQVFQIDVFIFLVAQGKFRIQAENLTVQQVRQVGCAGREETVDGIGGSGGSGQGQSGAFHGCQDCPHAAGGVRAGDQHTFDAE